MSAKRCTECGAELEVRPDRCPLCGAHPHRAQPSKRPGVAAPTDDVDRYQQDLRDLREQLRRLREDAEAV